MIRLPKTVTKPRIDFNNPLAKGLKLAIIGSQGAYDLVNRILLQQSSVNNGVSQYGQTLGSTPSNGTTLYAPFEVYGAVSVHAVIRKNASATTSGAGKVATIATNRVTGGESNFWSLNVGNGFGSFGDIDKPRAQNASQGIGSIYVNGQLTSGNNPSNTNLTNGQWYSLTFTEASQATQSGSGRTEIFSEQGGAFVSSVDIAYFYIFNKELSAKEVLSLHQDPRQFIYATREKRIYTAVSSGALPTLSAARAKTGSITSTGWISQITAS
jgi:hypothetical protein